ncbi:uncharacterized protein LOC143876552 [Tasmannia lanceolata]|uniref:uncharacterized protein LOC143876552 n=1 Tax=Tasmannia lanceolata TaxID=3420 RepID=UPI0040636A04
MSSLLLHVLLLSLSLHACSARHRHLGAMHKDSNKDIEKMKFDKKSIPAKPMQLLSEELHSQRPVHGEGAVHGSVGGAILEKPKDEKTLPKHKEATIGKFSGSENVMSSSHVGLRQATKLEELGNPVRSVLESKSGAGRATISTDESIGSQETDVMDYEKPHRKPPVNNKAP